MIAKYQEILIVATCSSGSIFCIPRKDFSRCWFGGNTKKLITGLENPELARSYSNRSQTKELKAYLLGGLFKISGVE